MKNELKKTDKCYGCIELMSQGEIHEVCFVGQTVAEVQIMLDIFSINSFWRWLGDQFAEESCIVVGDYCYEDFAQFFEDVMEVEFDFGDDETALSRAWNLVEMVAEIQG